MPQKGKSVLALVLCAAALALITLLTQANGLSARAMLGAAALGMICAVLLQFLREKHWLRLSWPYAFFAILACYFFGAIHASIYTPSIEGAMIQLIVFPLAYHVSRYRKYDLSYVARLLPVLLITLLGYIVPAVFGSEICSPSRWLCVVFTLLFTAVLIILSRRSTVPRSTYLLVAILWILYAAVMLHFSRSKIGEIPVSEERVYFSAAMDALLRRAGVFGNVSLALEDGQSALSYFSSVGVSAPILLFLRGGYLLLGVSVVLSLAVAGILLTLSKRAENSFARYLSVGVGMLFLSRTIVVLINLFVLHSGGEMLPFTGGTADLLFDILLLSAVICVLRRSGEKVDLPIDEDYSLAERQISILERLLNLRIAVLEDELDEEWDLDEEEERFALVEQLQQAKQERQQVVQTREKVRAEDPSVRAKASELARQWQEQRGEEKDRVFISLHNSACEIASGIYFALQQKGIPCWYYKENQSPGRYADLIAEQIKHARIMIVLLNHGAATSRAVYREVDLADAELDRNLVLLPVLLEPVELKDGMKYYLNTVSQMNVSALTPEQQIQHIVQRVEQLWSQ